MIRRITGILMLLLLLSAPIISGCTSKQTMTVGGQSMIPALQSGAKVVVDKKAYTSSTPQRCDIIAFRDQSNTIIIKRVIALPGETIEIRDG